MTWSHIHKTYVMGHVLLQSLKLLRQTAEEMHLQENTASTFDIDPLVKVTPNVSSTL